MDRGTRSKTEMEEIVTMIRLDLYNHGLSCGSREIRRTMREYDVAPLPSESTIYRILVRQGLTQKRTGWYAGEE